jgi:hypothetical protein
VDDFDERKARTQIVLDWIIESRGNDVAGLWAWETTPMPCGLPSDEQLEAGLRVATGEVHINDLLAATYAEMDRLLAEADERGGSDGE